MSDPEQPGSKLRRLLQVLQSHKSPGERVLHDILAVDHRSQETRAIAVQLGPQLAGLRAEPRPAVAVRRGLSRPQAPAPSSIVTPPAPDSPKAKPPPSARPPRTATPLCRLSPAFRPSAAGRTSPRNRWAALSSVPSAEIVATPNRARAASSAGPPRATTVTFAPCAPRASPSPRPRPRLPPVTTTFLS